MHDNLFVVSRLGQLRNAQAFIEEFGATGNHLAILYTDANISLLQTIEANIKPGMFQEVVPVQQPPKPLSQSTRRNRIVFEQVEDLMLKMVRDNSVDNLFLCNVDNYYSFFERVIQLHGLDVRTTLLEEGLGTYMNAGRRAYTLDAVSDLSDVKHRMKHMGRAWYRVVRTTASFLVSVVSWALRLDMNEFRRKIRTSLILNRKYRYGRVSHFDRAFVYYPDRISNHNLTIDEVHPLAFSLEMTQPQEVIDTVKDGAVVFVAQRYVGPKTFLDVVLRIMDEMGIEEFYFKFHPRQTLSEFGRAWYNQLRDHPKLKVLYPAEIQAIPVEELMMAGKVSKVIGLTSTSLMYAQSFFPGIESVSIGSRFKELVESDDYEIPAGQLAEFNRDLEVFLDVSGVPQWEAPSMPLPEEAMASEEPADEGIVPRAEREE